MKQERGPRTEDRGKSGKLRTSNLVPRSSNLVYRTSILDPRLCGGFTLLELLVVIVIIAIAAALVAPRLPTTESMELQGSARTLAATIRYLEERAVAGKMFYRLRLNISANTVRITRKLASGDEIPPDDRLLDREIFGKRVAITDVSTPRLGKVSEGEVVIDIGGAGLTDFLT
ncbi:MAG TPA: prepilin-type N-terminal cleavage/methylation domain-containing protein, partial [Geobacteraceae bacterium]|nr:prepilin-type N-terminal cleavage/methylation domain-containing protein [Geobacteraceae bacterium]